MRDTFDRHPDFGLLGIGLDQSNLPSVQEPEHIELAVQALDRLAAKTLDR